MSDDDHTNRGIEATEVLGIRRNDGLPGTTRADHDVSVCDVRCTAGSQDSADVGRIDPVQSHHLGRGLANQASQSRLTLWVPNGLR